jgi:hypothetical protein
MIFPRILLWSLLLGSVSAKPVSMDEAYGVLTPVKEASDRSERPEWN